MSDITPIKLLQSQATDLVAAAKCVKVCQNRSCRKQGSAKVLAAFQSHPMLGVEVVGSSCLGQCGNGPMVMVMPDRVWYSSVQPGEVPTIVKRHLLGGRPVTAMLYRRFHPEV